MAQNVQSDNPPGRGKELIKLLQTTTLFKGLSDSEVKFFLSRCGRQRAKKFENIIQEGEAEGSLSYILEGQAYITREVGKQDEFLGMLKKGDTFGEAGLLMGGFRSAGVRTQTDCLLLVIQAEVIEGLEGEIAFNIMRNIGISALEKLQISNNLIRRLSAELQSLRPEAPDWNRDEEDFISRFGESPEV
jgi:CRP-like cAMP-binding protein